MRAPQAQVSCRAELTAGWVGAETVRGGWFRQVTPSGAEIVLVSDVSASLTVNGQVERQPTPQIVSVASGGQILETWTVPAGTGPGRFRRCRLRSRRRARWI